MSNTSSNEGLDDCLVDESKLVVLHSKNPVTEKVEDVSFELPYDYLLGKFFKALEFDAESDGKMHVYVPIHPDYLTLVYEYMMECKGVDTHLPLAGNECEFESGFGTKVRNGHLAYNPNAKFKNFVDILRVSNKDHSMISVYDAKVRNAWIGDFFKKLMPCTPTPEGKLGHARVHALMVLCNHYLQLQSLMRFAMRYIQWMEVQYLRSIRVYTNTDYVDFKLCEEELRKVMYGIFTPTVVECGLYYST